MNGLKPQVLRRRTLLPRMQQVRGMAAVGTGFDDLLEAAQKLRDEVQRKRKFVEGHEPGVEDEEDVQSHYQMLSEDAMEGPMGAKYKKVCSRPRWGLLQHQGLTWDPARTTTSTVRGPPGGYPERNPAMYVRRIPPPLFSSAGAYLTALS